MVITGGEEEWVEELVTQREGHDYSNESNAVDNESSYCHWPDSTLVTQFNCNLLTKYHQQQSTN